MEVESIFEYQKEALKNKDFGKLCKCAIEMAKKFPGEADTYRYYSREVAFFLGRINNRALFEELIYSPYTQLPPSMRPIRSFEQEEKLYDFGLRYPFLLDEELDYLEELYCSPDTYDMVSRMLYDGDEVLRRKLARFDEDHYEIKNTTFSKKLCLDVFNALILNELKYNIDEALEERYESEDDKRARALFYDCDLEMTYSPILVYNRRTNEIQMDETNLSDVFLIPVCNFYWAQINLIDAINLYTNCFGDEILAKFIYPTLEKENLSVSDVKSAAFCTPWFLSMENALMEGFSIKRNDYKLLEVRENIARKWLTYQNEKSLR